MWYYSHFRGEKTKAENDFMSKSADICQSQHFTGTSVRSLGQDSRREARVSWSSQLLSGSIWSGSHSSCQQNLLITSLSVQSNKSRCSINLQGSLRSHGDLSKTKVPQILTLPLLKSQGSSGKRYRSASQIGITC